MTRGGNARITTIPWGLHLHGTEVATLTSPSTTLSNDYIDLKRLIKARGLLESQPGYYRMKTTIALGTLAAVIAGAILAPNIWIVAALAVVGGFASTQVALLAHDVGHRQGFRGRRSNELARLFFGNLVLGVSHSWWTVKHNQHHATPNHVDKDPDIQFPMLAFSIEQIATRPRWLRPLIGVQALVLLFLLPFQALNMRVNSFGHLLKKDAKRPWVQAAVIAAHFIAYAGILVLLGSWTEALVFAAIHHAVFGMYNSSVFASNHKGMLVTDDGMRLDFLREQVTTSRNVDGGKLTDFWYGGLNYQIEHHLFPTMPRNRLAEAQPIIEQFCRERGVSYHSTGLFEAYREILSHLHAMGESVRNPGAASA